MKRQYNGGKPPLTIITKGHYADYIKEVYKSVWKALKRIEMESQQVY